MTVAHAVKTSRREAAAFEAQRRETELQSRALSALASPAGLFAPGSRYGVAAPGPHPGCDPHARTVSGREIATRNGRVGSDWGPAPQSLLEAMRLRPSESLDSLIDWVMG